MRTLLLWMARNTWLRERIPQLPFARKAVRRFMPGETLDDALAAARDLHERGIGIVFTRLGENLTDVAEADAVAAHYHDVLDRSAAAGIPAEISVKLTQLGLDIDADACLRHSLALAEHAERVGAAFFIDMEDSSYVDRTLDIYRAVLAAHPRTGICLQAYLRRTASDIAALLELGPTIRLVKGAYDEPAAIAFRSKAEVDASYQALSLLMGAAARGGRCRVVLGTHDSGLVERIAAFGAATGIPASVFEVAMLYGIRAKEALRLASLGYTVRTLVAYGEFWCPWYMRRRRATRERRLRPPPAPPLRDRILSARPVGRLARLGHLAVGSFLTSRLGSRLHLALHRLTGGRAIRGILGFETVVLTTTGRRSGRLIDAPLTAIREGDGWVVVASNGGKEKPPAWLLNLRAQPHATLAVGPRRLPVRAREATAEEHGRWWPEVVRRYAGYRTYRERTSREIPLVLLTPLADA